MKSKTETAEPPIDFTMDGHVEIKLDAAKYLVGVILSAVSKDDVTPLITAGHLYRDGDQLRVVATDRYRVHTAVVDAVEISDDFRAVVPAHALRWIVSASAFFGRTTIFDTTVRIEWIGSGKNAAGNPTPRIHILITDGVSTLHLETDGTAGNYPPVHRLFQSARDAESIPASRIRPEFFSQLRHLSQIPRYAPELKFTASENPNKPGPLLATFRRAEGVYAEALIQPNLIND